jgi:hypothetical protein
MMKEKAGVIIENGDGAIDDLSVSASGCYVRMYGEPRVVIASQSYGYSLYEFEVYGRPDTPITITD